MYRGYTESPCTVGPGVKLSNELVLARTVKEVVTSWRSSDNKLEPWSLAMFLNRVPVGETGRRLKTWGQVINQREAKLVDLANASTHVESISGQTV